VTAHWPLRVKSALWRSETLFQVSESSALESRETALARRQSHSAPSAAPAPLQTTKQNLHPKVMENDSRRETKPSWKSRETRRKRPPSEKQSVVEERSAPRIPPSWVPLTRSSRIHRRHPDTSTVFSQIQEPAGTRSQLCQNCSAKIIPHRWDGRKGFSS
jgi:hypothetical protein